MNSKSPCLREICLMLAAGLCLACGSVYAQEDQQQPEQKTKEAQAVSKEVYDKIQAAQEDVDAKNYDSALRKLNALRGGKLTEYELSNVLNHIGFVYYNMDLGQYKECAAAAREGASVGGIKNPDHAQISLGMCLYHLKQYDDAIAAFRVAARTERSRKVSLQWIDVINSDIARNEQIRLAEVSARRQQQQLEERQANADRGL